MKFNFINSGINETDLNMLDFLFVYLAKLRTSDPFVHQESNNSNTIDLLSKSWILFLFLNNR